MTKIVQYLVPGYSNSPIGLHFDTDGLLGLKGLQNNNALILHPNQLNYYKASITSMTITKFCYRIAGKFGGQNVWRIYYFQTFGGKKFGE